MSKIQLKAFRQWVVTLPEQDITIENAVARILIALDTLTTSSL